MKFTGMRRGSVIRSIKWLVSRAILGSLKGETSVVSKYWINKDFDTWTLDLPSLKGESTLVSRARPPLVSKQRLPPSLKGETHKRHNIKTNIKTNTIGDVFPDDDITLFDKFWESYPRKIGKGAARKSFERIKPDNALLEKMLNTITKFKASYSWTKNDGIYIPHPSTWLNQERWNDVLPGEDNGFPDDDTPPLTWEQKLAIAEQEHKASMAREARA